MSCWEAGLEPEEVAEEDPPVLGGPGTLASPMR